MDNDRHVPHPREWDGSDPLGPAVIPPVGLGVLPVPIGNEMDMGMPVSATGMTGIAPTPILGADAAEAYEALYPADFEGEDEDEDERRR